MPQGYYTIEQWKAPKKGVPAQWSPVVNLPFGISLTAAENALNGLGKPGLFRIVQMQRVIWAEHDGITLRLRKSHASSPENLDNVRAMFERTSGKYPIEEINEARKQQKSRLQRNSK
jgi:hypothetical protein